MYHKFSRITHVNESCHKYSEWVSFICITNFWICDLTSHVRRHVSYVTWLTHMCDMTPSYVWHNSFMYVYTFTLYLLTVPLHVPRVVISVDRVLKCVIHMWCISTQMCTHTWMSYVTHMKESCRITHMKNIWITHFNTHWSCTCIYINATTQCHDSYVWHLTYSYHTYEQHMNNTFQHTLIVGTPFPRGSFLFGWFWNDQPGGRGLAFKNNPNFPQKLGLFSCGVLFLQALHLKPTHKGNPLGGVPRINMLHTYRHIATHKDTLQGTMTHCNTRWHTATHTLQRTATHSLQLTQTRCNTLQHMCFTFIASVLQCVAVCCSVLQRVAVCCSVLQCYLPYLCTCRVR